MLRIIQHFSLFIISVWFGYAVTGYTVRKYSVLLPETPIFVAGEALTTETIAARYEPLLYMRSGTKSPAPVAMWYEVIDDGNQWVIVYHPEWEDEVHPNKIIHWLYSFVRASRYGYPLKDVEYIQINISKGDGSIRRIRYETTPGNDYDVTVSEHWLVFIECDDQGQCLRWIQNQDGIIVAPKEKTDLLLANQWQLQFGVATWNHLLTRINSLGEYNIPVLFNQIKFLDDRVYRLDKYSRKSQGDFTTREWKFSPIVGITISFIVLEIITIIFRRFIISRLS